jgi:hypothetical protein
MQPGDADAVEIVGVDVRGHVEFDAVDHVADEGRYRSIKSFSSTAAGVTP